MDSNSRFYETITEHRGWYLVSYEATRSKDTFASLNIVVIVENASKNKIIKAMEKELKHWLRKYPVPVYVSAWSNSDKRYSFDALNKKESLIGFINNKGETRSYWNSDENKPIMDISLNQEFLDNAYSNIPYITKADHGLNVAKKRQQIKLGHFLIFVLPFIGFFIYECILYFNDLAALIAFYVFLAKTEIEAFRMVGVFPQSKKQKEKDKLEALKNHYYYYCELNPEGFKKLKLDADEKTSKEKILREAKELKEKKS